MRKSAFGSVVVNESVRESEEPRELERFERITQEEVQLHRMFWIRLLGGELYLILLLCLLLLQLETCNSFRSLENSLLRVDGKDVDPRKFSVMQRIQRFAKGEKYDDAELDTGKKKIMSIFVTGSTGTLGNEFVEKLTVMKEKETRKTINIYPGYRTESKLKPIHFKHRPIRLDLGNPEMSIAAVPEEYVIPAQEVVLINNAGISLPTVDPKILQQCLMTNVLFPLKFIGDLISYDNQKRDVTIINISSGDGERCYLDPDISQQIASCKNFDELDEVMAELVEGVFDYDKEYARGPTPMYSLSKAFLNQGTILFDEMIHTRNLAPRYKIFAVCPGNFPSPMSTAEELACSEHRVSVSDAVDGIMPLIFERQFYSSGKFYRFGQEIPW